MKAFKNHSITLKVVIAVCLASLAFTSTANASENKPTHSASYYKKDPSPKTSKEI